jgi:aspartyl-tRNA(Asn)/glutamyl-tRNA(Gln) amidotransferase subunit A
MAADQHIFITDLRLPVGGVSPLPEGDTLTLAVKDLFDTAGVRTTYGSGIFRDHVPDATATAVARLEAAGYVMVGKANLHEFAWGITSENEHYGWVANPVAPGRIAGGSSGGCAAALAAGMVDAAVGTDSGGSIRIPAACCGVTGFKPTYGLVPLDGCFPLAASYDHAGPMARDVAGCERMMEALVPGFTPAEIAPDELSVGVAWTAMAQPLVRKQVEAAARLLPGARSADVPAPPAAVYPGFQREAAEVHERLWREHRDLYGENVATKLQRALRVTDAEVERASRERELYRERLGGALAGLDLLLTPTLAMVAPPSGLGDLVLREDVLRFTLPWNAVGAPALAMPCGPAELGLPASVQLVGRGGDDTLVLAAGRALEERLRAQRGGGSR